MEYHRTEDKFAFEFTSGNSISSQTHLVNTQKQSKEYFNFLLRTLKKTEFTEFDKKYMDLLNELKDSFNKPKFTESRRSPKTKVYQVVSNTNVREKASPINNEDREIVIKKVTFATIIPFESFERVTNFNEDFFMENYKKDLRHKLYVEKSKIKQLLNFMKYAAAKGNKFTASPAYLEAERLLLLSRTKRQTIKEKLIEPEDIFLDISRVTTIQQLKLFIDNSDINERFVHSHYMLILRHSSAVYCTKITPNAPIVIELGGPYTFKSGSKSFEIKVELYAVMSNQKTKILRNIFSCNSNKSVINLIATSSINLNNETGPKLTLKNINEQDTSKYHIIPTTIMEVYPLLTKKGCCTIGIRDSKYSVWWNRYWCMLNGHKLVYYNYPSEEHYGKPTGTIHLNESTTFEESSIKHLGRTSQYLLLHTTDNVYYFIPDTDEELKQWKSCIDQLLKYIKGWNERKNEFLNCKEIIL